MQTLDVSSPQPANALERSLFIRAEQIRAQFRIMPGAFVGSALVATLVVAMLCDQLSLNVLMPWLMMTYLLSVGRFILWRLFRRADPPTSGMKRWGRLAIAAGALSGVLWGIGGTGHCVREGLSGNYNTQATAKQHIAPGIDVHHPTGFDTAAATGMFSEAWSRKRTPI